MNATIATIVRTMTVILTALIVSMPAIATQRISEEGRRAISPEIAVGPGGVFGQLAVPDDGTAEVVGDPLVQRIAGH